MHEYNEFAYKKNKDCWIREYVPEKGHFSIAFMQNRKTAYDEGRLWLIYQIESKSLLYLLNMFYSLE